MPTNDRTALQRATSALLLKEHQVDLGSFLASERQDGRSYEQIARRLYHLTGEAVDVSHRTIRRWCHDLDVEHRLVGAGN